VTAARRFKSAPRRVDEGLETIPETVKERASAQGLAERSIGHIGGAPGGWKGSPESL
jgi:hypothetical protein